jgi:hypothetical protein
MQLGKLIEEVHDCYSTPEEVNTVYTQLLAQCKISAFNATKAYAIHSFLQEANTKDNLVDYLVELHSVQLAIKDTGIIRKRTASTTASFATNVEKIKHACDWCKTNRPYLKFKTTHTQDNCYFNPASGKYDVNKANALKDRDDELEKAKENPTKRFKVGRKNSKA